MKLINHLIIVDLDNGNKLLINALYGHIDEIDQAIYEKIIQWKQLEDIDDHILTAEEDELYESLNARGFLVHDDEEEARIKDALLAMLRYADYKNRKHRKALTMMDTTTPELIDAALELTDDYLECIDLCGGEPLLPKTKDLLAYLFNKKPDIKFSITTNGYYLDEFIDLFKTAHVYRINVALDNNISDDIPILNKIISGVEKCLAIDIPVNIRTQANEAERYFDEQIKKYGGLISFENTTEKVLPQNESIRAAAAMYKATINDTPQNRLKNHRLLSSFNPIINSITVSIPIRPLYSCCYAHENNLVVDAHGRMYTCLASAGNIDASIGTYYPTVAFKANSIYNRNIDTIEACNACIYSLLCGGGCPMQLKDLKDVFHPVCDSIKSQIHDLLPLLYEVEIQKYHNQER
ncbi:MAG: SPASM domain-containing protein [Defluviitaleaceae bacterium]|nr:SPASM domain-containing protein [Defluviitaleaceae bacterium]